MTDFLQVILLITVLLATFWFGMNVGMHAGVKTGMEILEGFVKCLGFEAMEGKDGENEI